MVQSVNMAIVNIQVCTHQEHCDLLFSSAPLIECGIQLTRGECETNKKIVTHCHHNQGNHQNWNLIAYFSYLTFICQEKVLKFSSKRQSPSSEVHLTDNSDNVLISIWLCMPHRSGWYIGLTDCQRELVEII